MKGDKQFIKLRDNFNELVLNKKVLRLVSYSRTKIFTSRVTSQLIYNHDYLVINNKWTCFSMLWGAYWTISRAYLFLAFFLSFFLFFFSFFLSVDILAIISSQLNHNSNSNFDNNFIMLIIHNSDSRNNNYTYYGKYFSKG